MQSTAGNNALSISILNDSSLDVANINSASLSGLCESLELVARGFSQFNNLCLRGLTVNKDFCSREVERSPSELLLFSKIYGKDAAATVYETALKQDLSCQEAAEKLGYLKRELDKQLFDKAILTDAQQSALLLKSFKEAKKCD